MAVQTTTASNTAQTPPSTIALVDIGISPSRIRCPLLDPEQFDHERELGVGRDDAGVAPRAVGQVAGDDQLARPADAHPLDPLVPPLDDLAGPELERERL